MADFKVGDAVLVNKKYKAVIRYIGPTSFKAGIWYGVELEKEKGKHNGTVSARQPGPRLPIRSTAPAVARVRARSGRRSLPTSASPCVPPPPLPPPLQVYGVTYFEAKPNHGTFVSKDDLTLYDPREEASSLVRSSRTHTRPCGHTHSRRRPLQPRHSPAVLSPAVVVVAASASACLQVTSAVRMNAERERARREAIQAASLALDADEEKLMLQRRQMLADTLMGEGWRCNALEPPASLTTTMRPRASVSPPS